MKQNALIDKTVAFAARIVKLHCYLIKDKRKAFSKTASLLQIVLCSYCTCADLLSLKELAVQVVGLMPEAPVIGMKQEVRKEGLVLGNKFKSSDAADIGVLGCDFPDICFHLFKEPELLVDAVILTPDRCDGKNFGVRVIPAQCPVKSNLSLHFGQTEAGITAMMS